MTALLAALAGAVREAHGWVAGVVAEVAGAPWPAAAALLGVGLVVLAVGARARRPLAAVGGAALGVAASVTLGEPVTRAAGISTATLSGIAATVAGAACGVLPLLFPALAGALPGALGAAAMAPPDQRPLALGLGAAVGAALGLVLARWLAAAVAGCVGALASVIGLAGLLHGLGAGRALSAHPVAVLAASVVLAVAGTAWQLPTAWVAVAGGGSPKGGRAGKAEGEAPEGDG
jgi:hypothetical protein